MRAWACYHHCGLWFSIELETSSALGQAQGKGLQRSCIDQFLWLLRLRPVMATGCAQCPCDVQHADLSSLAAARASCTQHCHLETCSLLQLAEPCASGRVHPRASFSWQREHFQGLSIVLREALDKWVFSVCRHTIHQCGIFPSCAEESSLR